jgi:endonuclease YncB( thermonuclease family)
VLAALILAPASAAAADNLAGQASVIDGDTLETHGSRIRLWGIDAPESSQLCRGEDSLQYRCGAKAANDLDAFIASRTVNCLPISLDRYGRTVATCLVGGADLGDWLVRNGLCPRSKPCVIPPWQQGESGHHSVPSLSRLARC